MKTGSVHIHQQLIEGCKKGDRNAQFRIYEMYVDAMLNTAFRLLKNEEDAEDVLQESFLKAFKSIDQVKNPAKFGGWLKRIVINRSIDLLQKRKIKFEPINEDRMEIPMTDEEPLDFKLPFEKVYNILLELPPGYRTVLSLYLLEGYDHQEISTILGISKSASLSQFHRGKKRLIKEIKKQTHEQDQAILRRS